MSVQTTAHGFEIVLAVPFKSRGDIYQLHQLVWTHVESCQVLRPRAPVYRSTGSNYLANAHEAVTRRTDILFRNEGGLVRIRVANAPFDRCSPVKAAVRDGDLVSLDVHLALWRTYSAANGCPVARSRQILERHGFAVRRLKVQDGIATGYKSKIDARIAISVAHVKAHASIIDSRAVAEAWRTGVGRATRFGYGMLVLH